MWQPFNARELNEPDGPFDSLPSHLRAPVWRWFERALPPDQGRWMQTLEEVAIKARLTVDYTISAQTLLSQIQRICIGFGDRFVVVVDAALHTIRPDENSRDQLDSILSTGWSAWTVAPDGLGLTSRVDPTAQAAAAQAIAPHDAASAELAEAWRCAYGPQPNASDAWDHSIKGIEFVLKPIVCPSDASATLGRVVGELNADLSRPSPLWKLVLPGPDKDYSVKRLVGMLQLLWPNSDRHGGSTYRPADLEESRALVHLAVTIVQWGRAGAISRR